MVFFKNIVKTIIVIAVFCLIWEWLEIRIYGIVQHRVVDDIMMLLFAPIIYKAMSQQKKKLTLIKKEEKICQLS